MIGKIFAFGRKLRCNKWTKKWGRPLGKGEETCITYVKDRIPVTTCDMHFDLLKYKELGGNPSVTLKEGLAKH